MSARGLTSAIYGYPKNNVYSYSRPDIALESFEELDFPYSLFKSSHSLH